MKKDAVKTINTVATCKKCNSSVYYMFGSKLTSYKENYLCPFCESIQEFYKKDVVHDKCCKKQCGVPTYNSAFKLCSLHLFELSVRNHGKGSIDHKAPINSNGYHLFRCVLYKYINLVDSWVSCSTLKRGFLGFDGLDLKDSMILNYEFSVGFRDKFEYFK